MARSEIRRSRLMPRIASASLALAPVLAFAQTGVFGQGALSFNPFTVGTNPEGRSYTLTPGIRAAVLGSDNLDLLPRGEERAGQLYELMPYARGSLNGANASGAAFVALRGQYRNGGIDDGGTEARATLYSWGNLRLVEDFAGVYARANVFDANRSPFAATSLTPTVQSANRIQYRDLEVSPYLYGRLQGDGNWSARYSLGYQDAGTGLQSSLIQSGIVQGRSDLVNNRFGVSTRAQVYSVSFEQGYDYRGTEVDLLGWYRVDPTLRAGLGIGYASNGALLNADGKDGGWGPSATVEWSPYARTFLRGYWADRYYGRNASLQAAHQASDWSFGLTYRTGITAGTSANLYGVNTASMFAAPTSDGAPTPTPMSGVGQTLVNQNLLPLAGTSFGSGVIDSPLVFVDYLVGTVGWSRARNSVLATVFVNNRRTAATFPGITPSDIDQYGGAITYRRQIDPRNAMVLLVGETRSVDDIGTARSTLDTLSLSWDHRIGPRTTGLVGGRLQRQNGTGGAVSYDEAAVFAWIDYRF